MNNIFYKKMYSTFNSSGNTGSCSNLCNYLDKEIKDNWHSHDRDNIKTEEVQKDIDKHGKGQLKKTDWKFVEIEYSPSHKEQQHLIKKTVGKTVNSLTELNTEEQKKVKQAFVSYVRNCQDIQAKNYNRERIKGGEDLKYYIKIESERKYKGYDNDVKNGKAKSGEIKKGLNLHAHVIQSRKSKDKKTIISPTSKHRNSSEKVINKQGFDRNKFTNSVEKQFDKQFSYDRPNEQTYKYLKAKKYNKLERKPPKKVKDMKKVQSQILKEEKKSEKEEKIRKDKENKIEKNEVETRKIRDKEVSKSLQKSQEEKIKVFKKKENKGLDKDMGIW